MPDEITFLSVSDICKLTRLSRASFYRHLAASTFPAPFYVGDRSPRWRSDVVRKWMDDVSTEAA